MALGAHERDAALVVADVTGICRQSRRKRTEPRAFPRRSLLSRFGLQRIERRVDHKHLRKHSGKWHEVSVAEFQANG